MAQCIDLLYCIYECDLMTINITNSNTCSSHSNAHKPAPYLHIHVYCCVTIILSLLNKEISLSKTIFSSWQEISIHTLRQNYTRFLHNGKFLILKWHTMSRPKCNLFPHIFLSKFTLFHSFYSSILRYQI